MQTQKFTRSHLLDSKNTKELRKNSEEAMLSTTLRGLNKLQWFLFNVAHTDEFNHHITKCTTQIHTIFDHIKINFIFKQ